MSNREKQRIAIHIRWMIRRDMLEVVRIEGQSFEFPWTEEDFYTCLRQRNCIGMVAEHDEQVVGFMIYELHKSQLRVINLAVHPDFRRQGIGTQMVEKLLLKLSPENRTRICLEVRETNVNAQYFFRENKFRAVSILHDYYEDTAEDAYLMQYEVPDSMHVPVNRIRRLAG